MIAEADRWDPSAIDAPPRLYSSAGRSHVRRFVPNNTVLVQFVAENGSGRTSTCRQLVMLAEVGFALCKELLSSSLVDTIICNDTDPPMRGALSWRSTLSVRQTLGSNVYYQTSSTM